MARNEGRITDDETDRVEAARAVVGVALVAPGGKNKTGSGREQRVSD